MKQSFLSFSSFALLTLLRYSFYGANQGYSNRVHPFLQQQKADKYQRIIHITHGITSTWYTATTNFWSGPWPSYQCQQATSVCGWITFYLCSFIHIKTFMPHIKPDTKTRVKNGSFIDKVPENKQLNNWPVLLYLRTVSCSYLCTDLTLAGSPRFMLTSACMYPHMLFNYEWHIYINIHVSL